MKSMATPFGFFWKSPSLSAGALLLLLCLAGSTPTAGAPNLMEGFKMPRVATPDIPSREVSITSFGAVPDGITLNTEAIRKAIETISERGGGRVTIPSGLWLTGPIELKSKVNLHVELGATLLFSPDYTHYPDRTIDMKGRSQRLAMSPIFGQNLTDIAITGRGIIDASGDAWRPVKRSKMTEGQWRKLTSRHGSVLEPGGDLWWPSQEARRDRRPNLLKLVNCSRILLENVTFQNSPGWNLNPTLCNDITIRSITVRNPWYSQNGDGLDLMHCRNVIVRDSHFDVGDDAICLKSGTNEEGRRIAVPTENVLIQDCVVYHGHGGVTIGSEMSSGVRNVRVDNCTFIGTDLGLRFKSTRGRGGIVEDIYISHVRMIDIATDAIGFNMYYGGKAPGDDDRGDGRRESHRVEADDSTPQFRNIFIQEIVCRGAAQAVALQGLPEMPIRGIHFRNVTIAAEKGIACTDAEDISFENVRILDVNGPVLSLDGARNITANRLLGPEHADIFVEARGPDNARITLKDTNIQSARRDFSLSRGATRDAFEVRR